MSLKEKENIFTVLFAIYVSCYVLILVIPPYGIGVIDDFPMLRTLAVGKPILYYSKDFPYWDFIEMGRFFPAAMMEYNALLLITDRPTPTLYYIVHAVQFVALIFFLTRILKNYTSNKWLVYFVILVMTLMASFTYSWFRLQMTERNIALALATFLFCYLSYQKNRRPVWLALAFIAANIAIYYKEMPSILIGTYAVSHLILSVWNKEADIRIRIFNIALLVSALIYLALYVTLVLPHGGAATYGKGDLPVLEVLAKNFLNYLFVVDPIIILIVLPLTFWRIYGVFVHKDVAQPFHDSLLAGASMYVIGHFVLNVYAEYYFHPVYIFALPSVFHFLAEKWKQRPWKYVSILAGILLVVNTIPTGLHYLTYLKYAPENLNASVDFLVKDIGERSPDRRANIFLDGVGRTTGKWIYFVFSEHLLYRGLTAKDFDLRSDTGEEFSDTYFPYLGRIPTPYTVFEKGPLPAISKGDYLIVSLFSLDRNKMPDNTEYLKALEKDYELLFRTQSRFAVPLVNLKEIGRYLISIGAQPGERLLGISRHKPSPQIPDYYVFIRK